MTVIPFPSRKSAVVIAASARFGTEWPAAVDDYVLIQVARDGGEAWALFPVRKVDALGKVTHVAVASGGSLPIDMARARPGTFVIYAASYRPWLRELCWTVWPNLQDAKSALWTLRLPSRGAASPPYSEDAS